MLITKTDLIRKTEGVALVFLVLVTLFMCLCPQIANAQIKGYAVQVAALSSQQVADELTQGLTARGINAYWVKSASPGMKPERKELYRVRIGKFPTIKSAYGYAEQLLKSGLLEAYAIAAYEPPASNAQRNNAQGNNAADENPSKVQSFTPRDKTRKESANEGIDVIAAIGTRSWLLLPSKDVLSAPQKNNSALSRELARLAASVGTRRWSLNRNVAELLAPPIKTVPSANSSGTLDLASAGTPLVDHKATNITLVSTSTNMRSSSVAAPEIPRRPASPAAPGGSVTSGRNIAIAPPPRLQGMIEMRDGRMFMKLRNTDLKRSFTGVARITLSHDKKEQDLTPMQFTLQPDREESFSIDEATVTNGTWILMVYDENGAARLVRGASLAPKQPVQNAAALSAADQNREAQGLPTYVSGFYDATGQEANRHGQNGGTLSQNETSPANSGVQTQGNDSVPAPQDPQVAPVQVTVVPR